MPNVLFRVRYLFVALSCAYCLTIAFVLWIYVPHFDFGSWWQHDVHFVVRDVPGASSAAGVLQEGDKVFRVDGQPVRAGRLIADPLQSDFVLEIERDGTTQLVEIVVPIWTSTYIYAERAPSTLLATSYLMIGAILLFSTADSSAASLRFGYAFVTSAVFVLSIQGFVNGVPGAWIGGVPLAIVHGTNTIYLGFLPREKPLPASVRRLLTIVYGLAILFALASIVEHTILIPNYTSFSLLFGVSLYETALGFSGLALLIYLTTLITRTATQERGFIKGQLSVLLLFLCLAIVPAACLTFLPRALFNIVILPFPIAISLLSLSPVSYFFIVFRRKHFGFDIALSKGVLFVCISLLIILCYSMLLIVLQTWLQLETHVVGVIALLAIPVWLLGTFTHSLLREPIDRLIFGDLRVLEQALPQIASQLAAHPEIVSLQEVIEKVTAEFEIESAALLYSAENNLLSAIASVNVDWVPTSAETSPPSSQIIVRSLSTSENLHPLMSRHEWIEMLVPLDIRDESVGFLALSPPKTRHFNAKHARFMQRVADLLAIGTQAIMLFEASKELSLALLSVQEDERMRIRSKLHDQSIQMLGQIHNNLRESAETITDPRLRQQILTDTDSLHTSIIELREICTQLYPATVDHGFKYIALELAEQFETEHQLAVMLDLKLPRSSPIGSQRIFRAVYQVLLESLQNIVKHANVSEAFVTMTQSDDRFVMSVVDHGVGGMNPRLSQSRLLRQKRIGVINMYEWATSVGGRLLIEESFPRGTQIQLEIPLLSH